MKEQHGQLHISIDDVPVALENLLSSIKIRIYIKKVFVQQLLPQTLGEYT